VISFPQVANISRTEDHSKVFVWGLNDKDQLGNMRGSKIKMPTMSEHLSSLKPTCIAGGSKSLFIVSNEGKVSLFYCCPLLIFPFMIFTSTSPVLPQCDDHLK
jgi:alpha-tubulin suppressor-like RCC1 family protein